MIHPDLEHLLLWPDGWNGYDALAPQQEAIEFASQWLSIYDKIRESHWDEKPLITGQGDGGVSFWNSDAVGYRKLELFFNADGTTEYMQVWGPGVNARIDDGDITSERQFVALWEWLYAKESEEVTNV